MANSSRSPSNPFRRLERVTGGNQLAVTMNSSNLFTQPGPGVPTSQLPVFTVWFTWQQLKPRQQCGVCRTVTSIGAISDQYGSTGGPFAGATGTQLTVTNPTLCESRVFMMSRAVVLVAPTTSPGCAGSVARLEMSPSLKRNAAARRQD